MPLHQMPSEPRHQRDRALQVHRIAGTEVSETRPLDRLFRQIEAERRVSALHHREAHAVDGHGRTDIAVAHDGAGFDHEMAVPRNRDAASAPASSHADTRPWGVRSVVATSVVAAPSNTRAPAEILPAESTTTRRGGRASA